MDFADHVAAVRRETDLLVAALGASSMDEVVPTCPEWTLRDLAEHVGGFTGFWTHVLCEGTGIPKTPYPDMPGNDAVAGWYAGLAASLVGTLEKTPPEAEVWTWVDSDHSARFVARRCAHELAVHRVDAQLVRGVDAVQPIAADLAADGIEEIFFMMGTRDRTGDGGDRTLHLHGTDRGDEWFLTLHADRLGIDRRHGRADLGLRGPVSDLELLLYQRPVIGQVERFGDETVLEAFYREFTFG